MLHLASSSSIGHEFPPGTSPSTHDVGLWELEGACVGEKVGNSVVGTCVEGELDSSTVGSFDGNDDGSVVGPGEGSNDGKMLLLGSFVPPAEGFKEAEGF